MVQTQRSKKVIVVNANATSVQKEKKAYVRPSLHSTPVPCVHRKRHAPCQMSCERGGYQSAFQSSIDNRPITVYYSISRPYPSLPWTFYQFSVRGWSASSLKCMWADCWVVHVAWLGLWHRHWSPRASWIRWWSEFRMDGRKLTSEWQWEQIPSTYRSARNLNQVMNKNSSEIGQCTVTTFVIGLCLLLTNKQIMLVKVLVNFLRNSYCSVGFTQRNINKHRRHVLFVDVRPKKSNLIIQT